jgi:hypothetical protein
MRMFQELLPLTGIIEETKELYRRQPNHTPDTLPIFGLTKGTALAVRYFCQNNQVRITTLLCHLEEPYINIMVSFSRSDAFNCALQLKPPAMKLYSFSLLTDSCSLYRLPGKPHRLEIVP